MRIDSAGTARVTPTPVGSVIHHGDRHRPARPRLAIEATAGDGPIDAGQAFERLNNAGIIVRPTGGYGLSDCLRVTIGSAEEMAAVSGELARIVGERLTATAQTRPVANIPT